MKTLAEVTTYDPNDLTARGYHVTIRDNGTMRLVGRSRWAHSVDGQTFIVPTPPEITRALESPSDDEPDVETAIDNWLIENGCNTDDWKCIRKGYLVR